MDTKFSEKDFDEMLEQITRVKKLCRVMIPSIKQFYKIDFNKEVYEQIDEAVYSLSQVFANMTIHYSSVMFAPIRDADYDVIISDIEKSMKIIGKISQWSESIANQSLEVIRKKEDDLFKENPRIFIETERQQGVGFVKSIINFFRKLKG